MGMNKKAAKEATITVAIIFGTLAAILCGGALCAYIWGPVAILVYAGSVLGLGTIIGAWVIIYTTADSGGYLGIARLPTRRQD